MVTVSAWTCGIANNIKQAANIVEGSIFMAILL